MLLILFGEKTCKKNDKKIISMVKNVLLSLWFEIQQVAVLIDRPSLTIMIGMAILQ